MSDLSHSPAAASECAQVLGHVAEAVEVTADAAEVTERRQHSVEPQTAAQVSVLHVCLTQFGVSFPIRRQPNVLTQATRLLDQVHVRHDLRRHLTKPLSVYGCHRHRHKEDKDLEGLSVVEHLAGMIHGKEGEVKEGTG